MAAAKTTPLFKYLDVRPLGPVGGRGNAVRLYMLANKMPFDEELVTFKDWGAGEKAKCIAEYNPAGVLPVLYMGGKTYAEHVSIVRYLAKKNGQYGKDAELDFIQDATADAHVDFRSAWAKALGEPETSEAVINYRDTRSRFYRTLEWYYAKKSSSSSPYLIGGDMPGFADAAVFNMVRDDAVLHKLVDMSPYPNLNEMFEAMGSITEVKEWITMWEARVVAA